MWRDIAPHKAQPSLGCPGSGDVTPQSLRCELNPHQVHPEASGRNRRAGDKQVQFSPETAIRKPRDPVSTATARHCAPTPASQAGEKCLQWGGLGPGEMQGKLRSSSSYRRMGQCGHWGKCLYDVQQVPEGMTCPQALWIRCQTSRQTGLGLWWGRRVDWHTSKEMNSKW